MGFKTDFRGMHPKYIQVLKEHYNVNHDHNLSPTLDELKAMESTIAVAPSL